MFGTKEPSASTDFYVKKNRNGGMAIHLHRLNAPTLRKALDAAVKVYDVEYESNKVLRHIHKIKDGTDIYLFANISETQIDTYARLRGHMQLEAWNPHTGEISKAECTQKVEAGTDVTVVRITLAPFKSLFIVGGR